MNPIDFISALDGKILLHANEEIVSRSANVAELAKVFAKHGAKVMQWTWLTKQLRSPSTNRTLLNEAGVSCPVFS